VDTQHRILIEKLNELESILEGPLPPKAACDELLDFLENHVQEHFHYEEGCMRRARCPAHSANKLAHDAFLRVFGRFRARYLDEGPSRDLLGSLQRAASEWTQNHILTQDIHLRACSTV
jgi:hemerythrin-like metal-binding protein